jgi:hypothetical protein
MVKFIHAKISIDSSPILAWKLEELVKIANLPAIDFLKKSGHRGLNPHSQFSILNSQLI